MVSMKTKRAPNKIKQDPMIRRKRLMLHLFGKEKNKKHRILGKLLIRLLLLLDFVLSEVKAVVGSHFMRLF